MFLKFLQNSLENTCARTFIISLIHKVLVDLINAEAATEMFCKKGVLKNLVNFIGNYLCWSLVLIKVEANEASNRK